MHAAHLHVKGRGDWYGDARLYDSEVKSFKKRSLLVLSKNERIFHLGDSGKSTSRTTQWDYRDNSCFHVSCIGSDFWCFLGTGYCQLLVTTDSTCHWARTDM